MQLGGKPPELIDQVRTGAVDIIWTLPGYTPGRFPIMEVFELPFMSKSAEATSHAAWDYYVKHGTNEFKDYKPLAFHVHDDGFIHIVGRIKEMIKTGGENVFPIEVEAVLPEPVLETVAAGEPADAGDETVRLADELVTRAAQTRARITFVQDPQLLADFGGVAAMLRFAI